ncbi:MAG: hypothetical protein GF329_17575 [Candidatus Lokiarchaeota archaeon]|nr:hypothetical protein [Candidatus Lokiarchaeota archaeon]
MKIRGESMKKTPKNFVILSILSFLIMLSTLSFFIPIASAAYTVESTPVGVALCIASGMFGISGGYGIARTGSAAISALVEKPETFVKSFMIVVLSEAVTIYGLLLGIFAYLSL